MSNRAGKIVRSDCVLLSVVGGGHSVSLGLIHYLHLIINDNIYYLLIALQITLPGLHWQPNLRL